MSNSRTGGAMDRPRKKAPLAADRQPAGLTRMAPGNRSADCTGALQSCLARRRVPVGEPGTEADMASSLLESKARLTIRPREQDPL